MTTGTAIDERVDALGGDDVVAIRTPNFKRGAIVRVRGDDGRDTLVVDAASVLGFEFENIAGAGTAT